LAPLKILGWLHHWYDWLFLV